VIVWGTPPGILYEYQSKGVTGESIGVSIENKGVNREVLRTEREAKQAKLRRRRLGIVRERGVQRAETGALCQRPPHQTIKT
jgi:hypothetical protein